MARLEDITVGSTVKGIAGNEPVYNSCIEKMNIISK